ncbi:MAG: hypothetical protein ABFC67_05950 [Mizugakiibacter sp.]|uniref:hypothetical protein n=1 Tax=Mizugakiibacter sp. TaxID=1972610 RepID=UPI00320F00F0
MIHPLNIMSGTPFQPDTFNGRPVQYYNNGLSGLLSQFTGNPAPAPAPKPVESWQTQTPANVTELLRQLSANAGQMAMPGGPVGGVQQGAFGSNLPAINNPDMRTYGRTPGYGEATFFRQSMQGGMAPIAAMSPVGVPQNWNPTGSAPTTPATPPKPTTPTAAPKPAAAAPKPTPRPTAPPPIVPRPIAPWSRSAQGTTEQQLIDYLNMIGRR